MSITELTEIKPFDRLYNLRPHHLVNNWAILFGQTHYTSNQPRCWILVAGYWIKEVFYLFYKGTKSDALSEQHAQILFFQSLIFYSGLSDLGCSLLALAYKAARDEYIYYRVSSIQYQASMNEHRVSNIEHRETSIQYPVSSIRRS